MHRTTPSETVHLSQRLVSIPGRLSQRRLSAVPRVMLVLVYLCVSFLSGISPSSLSADGNSGKATKTVVMMLVINVSNQYSFVVLK